MCGSIAQTQVSGYVNYNVDMEPEVRQWMVGLLDGQIVEWLDCWMNEEIG